MLRIFVDLAPKALSGKLEHDTSNDSGVSNWYSKRSKDSILEYTSYALGKNIGHLHVHIISQSICE